MAQLRDSRTSEFIASGTAEEMVLLADRLGADNVLFDDVGLGFNPDAVREAHESRLQVARAYAKDQPGDAADALVREAEAPTRRAAAAESEARARARDAQQRARQ